MNYSNESNRPKYTSTLTIDAIVRVHATDKVDDSFYVTCKQGYLKSSFTCWKQSEVALIDQFITDQKLSERGFERDDNYDFYEFSLEYQTYLSTYIGTRDNSLKLVAEFLENIGVNQPALV